MEKALYVRLSKENRRFIFKAAHDSNQTLRDVVELMVEHCRNSKSFKVPVKPSAVEKALALKQRRDEHFKEAAEA